VRACSIEQPRVRGRRLCEPCAHLDRLNGGGVLRPLVHRGGLRADVVCDGTVRVGDRLTLV
jgi:MOSC domain-containing protein YiiM